MPSQRGHMPPAYTCSRTTFFSPAPLSAVIEPVAVRLGTLNEYAVGGPMCGVAIRLNRIRSIAFASVAVPTVDRGFAPIRSWSTMIAVVRPSRTSTSGRASVGRKPCTTALYVSLIIRCDSAAIVANTSELLPEPETPVNTVSRRFGSSTLTSLRLFSRAPCTRIRSWLSARCRAAGSAPVVELTCIVPLVDARSAQLIDADQIAGRVADGAVADPVRLLHRFLHDFDTARLQPIEGAVQVPRGQQDHGVGAFGHHLEDRAPFLCRDAGVDGRRVQHDRGVGLVGGSDGDPAHSPVPHVVAHLEAEEIAVEAEGGVGVGLREHARVDADVHAGHARCRSRGCASPFLTASRFFCGRVTCFATHDGMSTVVADACRR